MENKKMGKFDIDIEIKDFLWEFLRRWRLIVVLAIVCGVALGGYQYHIDKNKTDVVIVKKNQEELEKSMGTQDLDEVSAAVALKRQADERSAYMEASELMRINPYEENVVFLQYYVSADTQAADIREAYVTYLNQGSLETELISVVRDSDTAYYNAKSASDRAAYTFEEGTGAQVFSVKVIGATAEAAAERAAAVKNAVQEYSSTIASQIADHRLKLIDETSTVVVDQKLAELQNWNATAIKTICNNLDSMKNEMTSDQILLYTYRITVSVDTADTATAAVNGGTENGASISLKHVVIGMIVGIVLACGVIFVSYLFAAALRSEEEVKTLYQINVIGTVDDRAYQKKKLCSFADDWLVKLQKRGKTTLSYEQELQMIAANIVLDCAKNDTKQVFLTSSTMENLPEIIVKDITEKCKEKGIAVVNGGMLSYDAQALETAATIGSVVFVEKKRVSLYDELYKEARLCKEHEIHVAGMIVMGA